MKWVAAALALAGCNGGTTLFLDVGAPFAVPSQCNALSIQVTRLSDGHLAYEAVQPLGAAGPQFPLTESLDAVPDDVGVPLSVTVAALNGPSPAAPWATATAQTTLAAGRVTRLSLCLGADAGSSCFASP
jgi:hypothetical protein